MITCPFNSLPIHIPLQYNDANSYALYDKFLVALSAEHEKNVREQIIYYNIINLGQF